jgi:6-phospho-beta-glucosidase
MKIAILGAAGVRTPLIVQAMLARQDRIGLTDLSLMDIDADHLELISKLTSSVEQSPHTKFRTTYTTDPILALSDADFVITTFRVGGIESRVIDERVPLDHGILGQETTGAGGFAMGLRSIPVMLEYVNLMQQVCPSAWLINFANPAGMLTEAVVRYADWHRVVGICDSPTQMHKFIAAVLQTKTEDIYLDYFGLNHLGWIKSIIFENHDHLPAILQLVKTLGNVPGLSFNSDLILSLGMIPNEYLYYYYYQAQSVQNIISSGVCRGEQIASQNLKLFTALKIKSLRDDIDGMQLVYQDYLAERKKTYMVRETGKRYDLSTLDPAISKSILDEGYAGVALDLIEAISGNKPRVQILNVPNQGTISMMDYKDVVEIPVLVSHNQLQPMVINDIPDHCLGLMTQVKHYEHMTIEAAVEKSYHKALLALTIHPLVGDYSLAKSILDQYLIRHQEYFPPLH